MKVQKLSVEEYHRFFEFNERGRRTELIRGIVLEKPLKQPLHSSIAKAVYDLFLQLLPSGYVVRREDPLTLADSEPEPDLAVVKGSRADFVEAHPVTAELVVEVAVSSPDLDRANTSLYAEAGVKEYWIILGWGTTRRSVQETGKGPVRGFRGARHDSLLQLARRPC